MKELIKVNADVMGMIAILSYEFPMTECVFKENKCTLYTLSKFSTIINIALEKGYVCKNEIDEFYKWHSNPYGYIF